MKRFVCMIGLALITLAGCGGDGNPKTYQVTGVVKLNDKVVEGATIVFVPEDKTGKAASGKSDAEGKFAMGTFGQGDGVVSGSYKIKVSKFDGLEPPAEKVYKSSEEESETYNEGDVVRPPKNVLPAKYANESTSGFSVAIQNAEATVDLTLTGK